MKLEDIKITPFNHAQFDKPSYDLSRFELEEILTKNNTLTDYIEHHTGVKTDWGFEYANFLQGIGIEHQTENGWWSLAAVKPENINYFIRVQKAEDCEAEYEEAASIYKKIRSVFICNVGLVEVVVKVLTGITQTAQSHD